MCGIVGIAGYDLNSKHNKLFKDLLYLDTIRGPDSTGILRVDDKWDTTVLKNIGTPWDVIETLAGDRLFRGFSRIWLGHNRWATKGKVNRINAHPFEFKDIIGVHNGTLIRQNLLPDHEYYEVDSENIFACIQEKGVKETINLLAGAYTLVWYNKVDRTINFIRNSQRPLFYVYSKDNKLLLWASEVFMLRAAAVRNKLEISSVREVSVDSHYKFNLPKKIKSTFPQPERESMLGHQPPVYENAWMGWGRGDEKKGYLALVGGKGKKAGLYDPIKNQEWCGVEEGWVDVAIEKGEKITHYINKKYENKSKKNTQQNIDNMQIDSYGVDRIGLKEFKFLTQQICAVCAGDIEFLDKDLFWADTAFCVCSDCYRQTDDGLKFVQFAELNRWNGYANEI